MRRPIWKFDQEIIDAEEMLQLLRAYAAKAHSYIKKLDRLEHKETLPEDISRHTKKIKNIMKEIESGLLKLGYRFEEKETL